MDNRQGDHDVQSHPHWLGVRSCAEDHDGSLSVPARALNITWGNDTRYWEWIKLDEENIQLIGFEEAAMLHQVNWLEITGKFSLQGPTTPPKSYKVYYVLKFKEDAFGWNHVAIKYKMKLNYGDDDEEGVKACEVKINLDKYRSRPGVWHQVPGGEFFTREGRRVKVEFGMFEVESAWWKGGMILGGIKIKPCYS